MDLSPKRGVVGHGEFSIPMPHHPALRDGEGEEDSQDVQLDKSRDAGVKADDQQNRHARQDENAVAEDQSVTAAPELAGQVSVAAEYRGENRETVVSRVRRENEHQHGEDLQGVKGDRALTEDGASELRDDCLLHGIGR